MPVQMPDLFQSSKKNTIATKHSTAEIGPLEEELETTVSRLRVLEERYTNLQTEVQVTEENMIRRHKQVSTELKTLTSDINEIRRELNEIKDNVLLIIKELQGCAKAGDVKVLEKYIHMWEPLNFVTHQELQDAVNEKLGKNQE